MTDIAVVITCYNLGRTLEQALNSVLAQTRPAAEIVIVDDGSTDLFTQQLLLRIQRPKTRVVRTANKGVSAARNVGIEHTTAPYVLLLDADDWFDPTYFEKAAGRLDADGGLDFVSCAQRGFGALDYVWKPPEGNLVDHVTRGPFHISTMFRRKVWETVGGFREGLEADEEMDFWTSVLATGFRGDVLDEPLLNYRVRPNSMYHRMLQRETYLRLRKSFYERHLNSLEPHFQELLLAKESMILEQRSYTAHLAAAKAAVEREVASLRDATAGLVRALADEGIPALDWGEVDQTEPLSRYWGVDRGQPINRYYIEAFLRHHQADICGHVLEMKDSGYTHHFGTGRVTRSDVLDIDCLNPDATIVADLARAENIPSNRFDCFILTQTLNFIFDVRAALSHALRILRPGGVLLASVSALDRISYETGPDGDYWRFTEGSLRALLAEHLPLDAFEISGFGNVATCAAYLYGIPTQEIDPNKLNTTDPWFPLGYFVRAVKPINTEVGRRPESPLVSIVTAFYNAGSFLSEAIDSVLAQSYDRWELLLVDDGSQDESTRTARRYADQHPERVYYIEHPDHENRGAAASRNLGIRRSKGEYVAILDADDVWLPHKLERQVRILESEPRAAMVCGRSLYWHGWTGSPEDFQRDHAPDLGIAADKLHEPPELLGQLYPLGNGGAPCPSDILLRRSSMERDGGFEEHFRGDYQLYEDQAFLTKVYLNHPVFVSTDLWDKYRIHSKSCVFSVTAAGKYDAVRYHFLCWFEKYLSKAGVRDDGVWSALRNAIAPYRQSGGLAVAPTTIEGDAKHRVAGAYPGLPVGIQTRKTPSALLFVYHRIAEEVCDPWGLCVTPKRFDEHLRILKKFTRVIPLRQLTAFLADGDASETSAVITFDDGYADNLYSACPLLARHELPATLFVVSNYIGEQIEFWWDELERLLLQPGTLPDSFELDIQGSVLRAALGETKIYSKDSYLSNHTWRAWETPPTPRHALYYSLWKHLRPLPVADRERALDKLRGWAGMDARGRESRRVFSTSELSAVSKAGLIEIGCHTMSHPQLSLLPVATQRDEVRGCKQSLEALVGNAMTSFAYPYGGSEDFTAETADVVRQSGFSVACSTLGGGVNLNSDVFRLPRIPVDNWSGAEFEKKLSAWMGADS